MERPSEAKEEYERSRLQGLPRSSASAAPPAFDPSRSGAEWWTQVIDARDEIGTHWDKDYGLESANVNVHPQIATVTYLRRV
jgi:hypothetical protein|tara:strand:- start:437 stop:682 length:246 start_codon:yes stop_codon:yes gene_type:complete|eukprot:20444-Pelagococcus_subviridis.AAC.2